MITATTKWQLKLERPVIVFMYRMLARWAGGYPILLLTTTGRKTRRQRTVPVTYKAVEGGFLVTAANIGFDVHPGWFLNLQRYPQAQVQIGRRKIKVLAEEVPTPVRERLWAQWIQTNPGYQTFQARTTRQFPMVVLKPIKPEQENEDSGN